MSEGSPDPNELLENLSPPIIRYKQIPIKIKPPVTLPENVTKKATRKVAKNENATKKSSNIKKSQVKSSDTSESLFTGLLDTLGDTIKDVSSNSNNNKSRRIANQKEIARKAALEKAQQKEIAQQIKIAAQRKEEEKKRKEAEEAKKRKIAKTKPVAIATSSSVATLTVQEGDASPTVVAKIEVKPVVNKPEKPKETLDKKVTNSFDALFIKIKALEKKDKWKDITNLLRKDQKAAATKQGLVYQILCALNAKKISYSKIGRIGGKLVKIDKKSSWGNYALALKHYYGRKQNIDKAMEHLDIAIKSKKVAPGASKLYWVITLKKYWIVLLILLGAIVGGIDFLIKKKKKKDLENKPEDEDAEASESTDETESEIDENRPEGFKGKLYDIKQKLNSVISKVKGKGKKKADPIIENEDDEDDTTDDSAENDEDTDSTEDELS